MLMLLELPLIGYTVSPEKATAAIERGSSWLSRDGAKLGLVLATIVGFALVGRGIGGLLS